MRSASHILLVAVLIAAGIRGTVQAAPKPAPAFEIALLSGKSFRLADHRGTAVVILFWAPW